MKSLLILVLLALIGSPVNATDLRLKLICKFNLATFLPDNTVKKENLETVVEVSEYNDALHILSSNLNLASALVDERTLNVYYSQVNNSTDTKWAINNLRFHKGALIEVDWVIDRSTGLVTYRKSFSKDGLEILDNGSGRCEKVDTSKNKF